MTSPPPLPGSSAGTWVSQTLLGPGDSYTVQVYAPHPSPSALARAGADYPLEVREADLALTLPQVPGAASGIFRGSHFPICGWVSKSFDEKEPAPTIAWKARLAGDTVLRSEIVC